MHARELLIEGVSVIELEGELDMAASPILRGLLAASSEHRQPALILDFSKVKYVDSSGIATLIEHVRNVEAYGGKFAIAGVNQRVQTVFELVRLEEFLPIQPTVAEARAALGKS